MSIDVGAILDAVQPLVESTIETTGSEWTILRNPRGSQDTATNRVTGAVAETAPEVTVAAGVPGIWVPDTGGGAVQAAGVNLPGRVESGTLLLLPDVTDVQELDVMLCTASRDARLVGRRLVVRKVPDASAGAVRRLECDAEKVRA